MLFSQRRRIFRRSTGNLPRWDFKLPSTGLLSAAAASVVVLLAAWLAASWLFAGSADHSVHLQLARHLSAGIDRTVVLDGASLRLGDQVVQLEGIVAPARGSTCRGTGVKAIDCGSAAANALAALVRGRAVECMIEGDDGHGHATGRCTAGGTQLNEALVRDGWARASTAGFRASEAAARAAGYGIWR